MKSSRPSSAQWMSSKTSTSGLRSASPSKNVRQAVNDSSRLEAPASSSVSPTSGRKRASTQSGSTSTTPCTARPSFSPTTSAVSSSRMPAWAFTISAIAQ